MRNYCFHLKTLEGIDKEVQRRIFKDVKCMYVTTYEEKGKDYIGTIEEHSVLTNKTNSIPFRVPQKIVSYIEDLE
jgi:hypothetical protein